MFVGVARFELFIPEATSLKDKRSVLRSVTATVTKKFNVSIAEVDHQNLWQRAALGISCVSQTMGQCRKVLQEVERAVGRSAIDGAEIVGRSIEVFAMEDLL
ncbi:MAG: DUF503 domain-containing protein [Actinobacteria bacterium]|jgi:uncharacterized protein YlxP (DUF503 family)|nr:DUF503 domain-containing protein [Actinomycetota bacterium]